MKRRERKKKNQLCCLIICPIEHHPKIDRTVNKDTSALCVGYVSVRVRVCKHTLDNSGSGIVEDTVTRHHLIHLASAN